MCQSFEEPGRREGTRFSRNLIFVNMLPYLWDGRTHQRVVFIRFSLSYSRICSCQSAGTRFSTSWFRCYSICIEHHTYFWQSILECCVMWRQLVCKCKLLRDNFVAESSRESWNLVHQLKLVFYLLQAYLNKEFPGLSIRLSLNGSETPAGAGLIDQDTETLSPDMLTTLQSLSWHLCTHIRSSCLVRTIMPGTSKSGIKMS